MAETKVTLTGEDRTAAAFNSLNQSLSKAENSLSSAKAAVGGFLGAFGVGFLANQVSKALEFADSISEVARNTAMTTRTTQELQYAFIQSGSSGEAYNKVMMKFVNTVGEAASGSRSAVDALEKVGITQEDLKRNSMEQLWVRTSNALSEMTSAAERSEAGTALLSKVYKEAASAVSLSSEELKNLRAEANITGAVLDAQVIKNAKKSKDEMEQWSRVISIQLTEAFVNLAPFVVKSAQQLADVARMLKDIGQELGVISAISFDDKYDVALKKFSGLNDEIARLEERARQHGGVIEPFVQKELESLKKKREETQKELDQLRGIWKEREALKAKGKDPDEMGGAAAAPAATKIKAPEKTSEESKFEEQMRAMQKASEQAQASMLSNEKQKSEEKIRIASDEFKAKVDYGKLNLEQQIEFDSQLDEYKTAALNAENQKNMEKEAEVQAKVTAKFETLRAQFDDEFAMRAEQKEQLAALDEYYGENDLERDAQYWEIKNNITSQGLSRMSQQVAQNNMRRAQMYQTAFKGDLASVSGVLGETANLMQSGHKTQFEIGKKAAIAQAVVNTYMAAASGFATPPFFPVGIAMGALAIANGLMTVSKIKSQSFESGGSPAVPTFSASPNTGIPDNSPIDASSTLGQGIAPSQDQVRQRNINVTLVGSRFTAEEVRELIGQINEEQSDGVTLRAA